MKTINIIGLILILAVGNLKAQVMNPGFEDLNSDGSIQYWGIMHIMSAWVDTSGVFHTDSVVIDQSYCATTNDAHSGLRAVEMRNAYDYTINEGIAGGAFSSSDTMFSTYAAFSSISGQPSNLSFYYKYFPVNGDTASALIELYDSGTQKVGSGIMHITGTISSYTFASVPITYTSTDTPSLMFIHFNASSRGKNAQFGTRFLVDDVAYEAPTNIHNIQANNTINAYPNPVPQFLSIRSELPMKSVSITSFDGKQVYHLEGDIRMVDCSKFAEGVYMLSIETSKGVASTKLVVKR